jgi:hypothetical protein
MDPNANLAEQAEILDALRALRGQGTTTIRRQLAHLRADLTDWLNAGGFAPDWTRYPVAARYFANRMPVATARHVWHGDKFPPAR